jgi:hypothetical protein
MRFLAPGVLAQRLLAFDMRACSGILWRESRVGNSLGANWFVRLVVGEGIGDFASTENAERINNEKRIGIPS